MKQRLLNLLNIKQSESNYVFDLLSIQLFIGIANSFINIVSFTFFIHHFAVSGFSYAYLILSGFLLLLNLGYEKLEKKLSPLHLLRAVIFLSAVILFLFWAGLLTADKKTMIFSLLVWGTLFYMVTGYAYWGLVSILFNIRESRRVFSIIGSGDIPAKLIGYMAAPLLIPVIGLDNLLLLSVASLVVGYLLLNRIISKKGWQRLQPHTHHHAHHHHHESVHHSLLSFFLQNKLIFFISLLSLLSYNVFNLIDFTFITQIKAKVENLSKLALYISVFFAVGRMITIALKLIFTSRMIERLGIITCLMLTPIMLFVCSILFVLFDQPSYTLYEFGIMAMLTEVFRSAMQEPVFFILFQPLNEHNRLRGHIIAKGYMLAPSLFIVGASLLAAEKLHIRLSIPFIINVLLVNLMLWATIIYYLKKAYAKALHQSIAKGVFSGEDVMINNHNTIRFLLEKTESGDLSEKIYALKLLESAKYSGIADLLQKQLFSQHTPLKKYAFERLDALGGLTMELLEQINIENDDIEIKELVITALCRIDPAYLQSFADGLPKLKGALRKNIILLLLKQKEFALFYKGCNEIQLLLQANEVKDRELALQIISDVKDLEFTQAIETLIVDENPSVKRNALLAACKLKSKVLLPAILQRLQTNSDKYLAMQGLFQYGDALYEDIGDVHPELVHKCRTELIKIAAKVKGPHTTAYLLHLIKEKTGQEDRIVHVLWVKAFRPETQAEIHLFEKLFSVFIHHGLKKTGLHAAVPDCKDRELIRRSIDDDMWNDLTTSLKIGAILYPRKELARIIELAENKERHRLYNAMEMLELVIPKKAAREINELLDYLLDPLLKKKHAATHNAESFFREIVIHDNLHFNQWTKAISMYSSWHNHLTSFLMELKRTPETEDSPLLKETRTYVLNNIREPHHADH